jgi:hypothetical protein
MDLARHAYDHYAARNRGLFWAAMPNQDREQIRALVRLLERFGGMPSSFDAIARMAYNTPGFSGLDAKTQGMVRDMAATVQVHLAEGRADDLTLIPGIGAAIEAMLNDSGVRLYEHLVHLDPHNAYHNDLPLVTPRRLKQWAKSARKLVAAREKVVS